MEKRVLFLDADPHFASRIAVDLRGLGVILNHVDDREGLLRAMEEQRPDLLLIGELPTSDPFSLRDEVAAASPWKGPVVVIHDGTTPEAVLSHGASTHAADAYLDRHGDPTENSQRIGWLLEATGADEDLVVGGGIVGEPEDDPAMLGEEFSRIRLSLENRIAELEAELARRAFDDEGRDEPAGEPSLEDAAPAPRGQPSQALLDILHTELAEAQAEKARLAEEVRLVRLERERVQDDLAARISDLAGDLARKDVEIAGLRKQLAASGGADLQQEIEELRAENEFLSAEIDRLGARLLQGAG